MVKISFKNVDQGDSIILEWNDDNGNSKVAIIDCNLQDSLNSPVLEYVKEKKFPEIEFLLLSHPHLDHYSGFYGLIDYCEKNHVHINWFLHTSMQVPEFLQTSARSAYATNELRKLFLKIRELLRIGVIRNQGYVTDTSREIELSRGVRLKFLAPSTLECDNFIRNVPLFHEEDGNNNPNANWLSTFIKIYSDKWYVLLTSDIDKSVLLRIGTQNPEELSNMLLLGQSPHHGARGNHRNSFWKTGIKNRTANTPIVFSVGRNTYRHPSKDAVDFFRNNGFAIFATNQVGYLNSIDDKILLDASLFLDTLSTTVYSSGINKNFYGDKVFLINDDKVQLVTLSS